MWIDWVIVKCVTNTVSYCRELFAYFYMLFIFTQMFIDNELIQINVTYNFRCRFIKIVCHVYIVILYVLYDDVCMYASLHITFLLCFYQYCAQKFLPPTFANSVSIPISPQTIKSQAFTMKYVGCLVSVCLKLDISRYNFVALDDWWCVCNSDLLANSITFWPTI